MEHLGLCIDHHPIGTDLLCSCYSYPAKDDSGLWPPSCDVGYGAMATAMTHMVISCPIYWEPTREPTREPEVVEVLKEAEMCLLSCFRACNIGICGI